MLLGLCGFLPKKIVVGFKFKVKIKCSGFQEICCMIYIDNNVVDRMFYISQN